MGEFDGRTAVVLGRSGAIGSAICVGLRERGARVASVSRSQAEDADMTIPADVRDEAQMEAALGEIDDSLGTPTLLVCCAGVVSEMALERMALAEWRRVIDASLTGTFLAIRAALPAMRTASRGAIVAISSGYGRKGYRHGAHYAAAKAGVEALVKSVALEVAHDGIRANAVAPGPIETPMTGHLDAARRAAVTVAIPQGRIGTVDEVAEPVLFLLSDAASHITGQVLHVNGGLLMP